MELELAIVQEYLSGSLGYQKLGAKHGVGHATIRDWVPRYRAHSDQGLHKKFSLYDAQFKLVVLQQMRQHKLSYRQVVARFDVRGGVSHERIKTKLKGLSPVEYRTQPSSD